MKRKQFARLVKRWFGHMMLHFARTKQTQLPPAPPVEAPKRERRRSSLMLGDIARGIKDIVASGVDDAEAHRAMRTLGENAFIHDILKLRTIVATHLEPNNQIDLLSSFLAGVLDSKGTTLHLSVLGELFIHLVTPYAEQSAPMRDEGVRVAETLLARCANTHAESAQVLAFLDEHVRPHAEAYVRQYTPLLTAC